MAMYMLTFTHEALDWEGGCGETTLLSAQEDFKSTRSRVQEIVEGAGHNFVLCPRSHCELIFIVYCWECSKHLARKYCNYTLPGKWRIPGPSAFVK